MSRREIGSQFTLGRNGWLFLDHDTNDVFAQHAGELSISEAEISVWRGETATRTDVCKRIGALYVQLIAPDKHAVYSDFLPDGAVSTDDRPVFQVLRALGGLTRTPAIYPLQELKVARALGYMYPTTDTHWTDLGGFIAIETLGRLIDRYIPVHHLSLDKFEIRPDSVIGDLGQKCQPTRYGMGCKLESDLLSETHCSVDNVVDFTGRLRVFRAHRNRCPGISCIIFGNSFCSDCFLKLATQMFGATMFVFSDNVDYELIARERPKLVIHQLCERFLIRAPRDRLKLSGRERGFIRALDEEISTSTLRLAARRSAVQAGSPDCLELLAEKELLSQNKAAGHCMHEEASELDQQFGYDFPWALALGAALEDDESADYLVRATEKFPDRKYISKYIGYMLYKGRYEAVRRVGKLFKNSLHLRADGIHQS